MFHSVTRRQQRLNSSKSKAYHEEWSTFVKKIRTWNLLAFFRWIRFYLKFHAQNLFCHWELFLNKSEYYGKIYQLLELIGLGCGYSVIALDLILQSRLRVLFNLASKGSFNDPASISPAQGIGMHQAISNAHTLLATEREVIGAYVSRTASCI
jgi:hypothetical protein